MNSGTSNATTTSGPMLPELSGLTSEDLRDALTMLANDDGAGLTEVELVDQIRLMEQLKSGLAARQARLTVRLAQQRCAAEAASGIPADQRGRGLAAEIALARRESPTRGAQHVGLAKAL